MTNFERTHEREPWEQRLLDIPGGRFWEPGAEDAPDELPKDQWIPDDLEIPFD